MKIAIVKLSAMGDIIHAAVVLQFIRKAYPDAVIDWVVEEAFAPLLSGNPDIRNVHTVTLKRLKKGKKLAVLAENYRKLRSLGDYDVVIDMQGLIKSAIVSRLIGSNVCGFDKNSTREGVASLFYRKKFAVDYDMNVIKRGAALVSKSLGLKISDEDLQQKQAFLYGEGEAEKKDEIIVMVGASWPSKIYPAEQMAQMIETLEKEVLLVWGSETERQLAETIAQKTKLAAVAPKFTIGELISRVKASALVIGGDTGPVHMAWAQNRPSLTIFGPTPSFRNTLTTPVNRVIDTGKKIDPSSLDRNDFSIREIDPKKVAALVLEILKESHE